MNKDLSINIYSEPFPNSGAMPGEGATKLLGLSLTPLEILLRETLQNSWDASIEQKTKPSFEINLRLLKSSESYALKNFFNELPPNDSKEKSVLENFLNKKYQLILEICDYGTKGLGGPFSASEAIGPEEDCDFVNFVKNIGSHRDQRNGGGTYGFGKSSLFNMSKCKTILVDSLTSHKNKLQNRLIGYALGTSYDAWQDLEKKRKRFTGRHWWGTRSNYFNDQLAVDPIIDEKARIISRDLGLKVRNSEKDKGTSLVILDPNLNDIDENFSIELIPKLQKIIKLRFQEILLWHAWPKFTPNSNNERPMNCQISIFGEKEEIPSPERILPLAFLTNALKEARKKVKPIYSTRPRRKLGHIGTFVDPSNGNLSNDSRFRDFFKEEALIPEKLNHFALLRPAELVVKYIERSPLDNNIPQWAGVFICSDEDDIERAFAKSEPPTHDDWKPNSSQDISKIQKRFIGSAIRHINSEARELSGEKNMDSGVDWNSEYNRDSIAWLMNDIGSSILGKGIGGADGLKKSGKKKSKLKQTTKLTKPAYFKTSFINKKIIAEFKMTLSGKEGKNVQVELKPWILTEEGKVEYAPNGLGPKIVQVKSEKLYDLNEEQMQNYSQKSNYKEDIFNLPFELQRTPINIEVCVEVPDNVVITLIANLIIN